MKPSEMTYHPDPIVNRTVQSIYSMSGMIDADPDGYMGASIADYVAHAICSKSVRRPNGTLVRSRSTGVLYYSGALWKWPSDAVELHPAEFRPICEDTARAIFGDAVPRSPGEWATVAVHTPTDGAV